ncbi:MAG: biopolymer transporter ExbD [Spirochaetes bacterium]|jgi:biopolymer transport protein ExbD|nr:biopolymer transporter ExbD [Spirochaetota bacterium]
MLIPRRQKPKGIMPLPSMADIAFILLVFFILTSTIDIERNIPVALPGARSTESGSKKYFHVWIDAGGDCFVRGGRMDRGGLYRAAKYRAADNPDVRAMIGADANLPYRRVNEAMETLRDAGVYNIVLLSRKEAR